MNAIVWITTQFEARHRWDKAPMHRAFLREYHRHLFHVKVSVIVTDMDREVEFFDLKHEADTYIARHLANKATGLSCEHLAMRIANRLSAHHLIHSVEVSEDGENGATVYSTI